MLHRARGADEVPGRRVTAGPGDTVRIPPGTVHHFANAGSLPAQVAVQTRPALSMQELPETAAALAQDQHAAARRLPSPLGLALFMRDFERGGTDAVSPRTEDQRLSEVPACRRQTQPDSAGCQQREHAARRVSHPSRVDPGVSGSP